MMSNSSHPKRIGHFRTCVDMCMNVMHAMDSKVLGYQGPAGLHGALLFKR